MHRDDVGAIVRVGERDGNRHLAAQRRIRRLELDHFDNLFIRHEFHEMTGVRVGVCGRLAGARGCIIRRCLSSDYLPRAERIRAR